MTDNTYTSSELLTINAARLLRDSDTVFVGARCQTWRAIWRGAHMPPNLLMIYEGRG